MIELMDEHLKDFWVELVVGQLWDHTLTFKDFHVCKDPEFFEKKDPVASMYWIVDIECAFQTNFSPEGSKTKFATCLLRDGARDYWDEVGHALGVEAIEAMTWEKFFTIFREKLVPAIEVWHLAREFQDLH